jgi:hypothetical protein
MPVRLQLTKLLRLFPVLGFDKGRIILNAHLTLGVCLEFLVDGSDGTLAPGVAFTTHLKCWGMGSRMGHPCRPLGFTSAAKDMLDL